MVVTPVRLVVMNVLVLTLFYLLQVSMPLVWPSWGPDDLPAAVALPRRMQMVVRGVELPRPVAARAVAPQPAPEVLPESREILEEALGEVADEVADEVIEGEPPVEPAGVRANPVELEEVHVATAADPVAPLEMVEEAEPEAPIPVEDRGDELEVAVEPGEVPEGVAAPVAEDAPEAAPPEGPAGPTTVERYAAAVKAAREATQRKAWSEAVSILEAALSLEDLIGEQRAWLLYLQARAERHRGNQRTAARLYGQAIDHDPPGAHYKNSLAWLLATSREPRVRDLPLAVKLAEEAVRDGGQRAQYLDTLARAYFEAGRLADAVLTQRRAVERAPEHEAYRNRLSWYRDEATGAPSPG